MQDVLYFINQNLLLCVAWLLVLILLMAVLIKEKLYGPKGLSTTQVTKFLNQEDAILIDLRHNSDYSKGHITGAENFGSSELKDTAVLFKRLEARKNKPIILVCKDGLNSKQQAFKLKSKGIDTVSYLYGGMAAWQSEGLPTIIN
jgi:rhodanese-related sulfurtransferase